MAKILFLSVLLVLSLPMALGDSGWVISPRGMEHICQMTHEHAAADLRRVILKVTIGLALPEFLSAKVTECTLISIRIDLNPKIGLNVYISALINLQLAPLLSVSIQLNVRVVLHIGRHGLFVQACAVVDAVIKSGGLLTTDETIHVAVNALSRVLARPMCERGRAWCRELNYCFNFDPYPFPITPSCYGVWKNQQPFITENQIELRSQPVCSCQDMEEGVSVSIDPLVALRATISSAEQSIYFCHEKDLTYIFECLRKGGLLSDIFVSVSLTVGVVVERLPSLIFLCPRTASIVIKVECTRIYVDIHAGQALLCLRLRVSIGCNASNFTSSVTSIVTGCLSVRVAIDCRKELLLLSVSAESALRIRGPCAEGKECEVDDAALTELFLGPVTAWIVSHINAKIKVGIRLPFLRHYPCDRCQTPIYSRRRVHCPCTLRYAH